MTREAWLARLAQLLEPRFRAAGLWPRHRRISVRVAVAGRDVYGFHRRQQAEIVISPDLDEMVHASLAEDGHDEYFEDAARRIGLAGPSFATWAGPELERHLDQLAAQIGEPYPEAPVRWFTTEELSGSRARSLIMRRRGEPG
jgi:hypothetical protein